jgi:hypothetical protein
MYHPQIVRAIHVLMGLDKDGEGVGEQGGGHELFNFLGGGLGLHFARYLTCFALAHKNLFAEISKNGLGSIPLKVKAESR